MMTLKIRMLITIIVLSLFWLLLVDGDIQSLAIGGLFVALATIMSLRLSKDTKHPKNAPKVHIIRLPKFLWFFLINSIKGGSNTAKLAFSSALPLAPGYVQYSMQSIPPGNAMNLFVNLVSLLPGSVCVLRESSGVLVHVLDTDADTLAEIRACEMAVCNLFNISGRLAQNTQECLL